MTVPEDNVPRSAAEELLSATQGLERAAVSCVARVLAAAPAVRGDDTSIALAKTLADAASRFEQAALALRTGITMLVDELVDEQEKPQ